MFRFHIFLFLLQAVISVYAQCNNFEAREATIETVQHDLFTGLATCRTIVSSYLSRIQQMNGHINAIITLNSDALAIADELDDTLTTGNFTASLFCIPILLKDNYDTSDMKTTGGNLDLAGSQPSIDAPVVAALRKAGAIILGKANLHELALEGLSVSSLGGQTRNPYDFTRTPGGSSGGSAAAVAASFSVFSTGTDTVNSLRNPASANSLCSVRPTRGLISRAGIIPISYTQDAIGPVTRTVKDAAIALTVMAGVGYDPNDNATALIPDASRGIDYAASLTTGSLKGLRLGLVTGFLSRTASNETSPVTAAIDAVVTRLRAAGSSIIPINDPIYNASALIDSLDTQRFEYRQEMGAYLRSPALAGTHPHTLNELYNSKDFLVIPSQYAFVNTSLVSSTSNATYSSLKLGIQNLTLALQQTFTANTLDALIYPQQANLVVPVGMPSQSGRNGILGALTGSPVVTVPAGFSSPTESAPVGIPIGMEILGRPWTEEKLLRIGYQVEMLMQARRMPVFAEEVVEVGELVQVPVIEPDRESVPGVYPVGVL